MKILTHVVPLATIILMLFIVVSCRNATTPKPRGYFRIEFPAHEYCAFDTTFPYKFEYPTYAKVVPDLEPNAEPYWVNLDYPQYKAKVHMSYKRVNGNLEMIEEDSRHLAYKHTIKADAINERVFNNPEKDVYGILYEIKGDAASSVQFYMTDSIRHFVRGSLYFNVIPNKDSLAPVIDFVKKDIVHLMESFEWKK
ncbi:MAG: gliding motility lipoprotein GldD [Breznakibacter sp.]